MNTVEQILLGNRADNHRQRLNQFMGDDYDNHPTSRRVFDRYYNFAIVGNALDMDDDSLEKNEEFKKRRSFLMEAQKGKEMPREESEPQVSLGLRGALKAPANARPSRGVRANRGRGKSKTGEKRDASESADELAVMDAEAYFEADEKLNRDSGKEIHALADRAGLDKAGFRPDIEKYRYFDDKDIGERRKQVRQFYQRVKPTQEWVENNYYRLPVEQQGSQLVRINRFWRDYAMHSGSGPFLSPFFAESSRNFTEMMLALAVIDLPFEAPEHEIVYDNNTMTMTPKNDLIAFFEQVRPSVFDRGDSTVLVSENFFRTDDRYRVIDGKTRENFVRKEFLSNVLYGGQIVITNPTSTPMEIDLLIQIPEGALPANRSHETKTMQMDMAAFSTQTLEYFFYFPTPGDFQHYPAHVSVESRTVAVADGLRFNVVEKLSEIDTGSWAYISQNGTEQQVLNYLASENLQSIDLGMIAFRMKDQEYYQKVVDLLKQRFAFNQTLWSYSLKHDNTEDIAQYLQHHESFVTACGSWLESPLLNIRPVIRHMYQHREYWPLVNARAHRLGDNRKILNNAIWNQYHQLLDIIARQKNATDEARLAMTYYMLLQDRISEAIQHFERVSADKLSTQLQYDYCAAYLAMYQENPETADQIAKRYANHPVKRWRELFASVSAQVREINGAATAVVDQTDASQRQTRAASNAPSFDFVVESLMTKIKYQNLEEVTINYYQMDVELLFSRNPFVQKQDESFALIKPNATQSVSLSADNKMIEVELPEQFRTSNVLVEVSAGGKTKRQAYYANTMDVQTIEQYGQVKVNLANAGNRLSKVYVKVYARKSDGSIHFYKDGYTDLRGRFDYASLSNQDLNNVERFAILVISPDYGAVVREADVPKE